MVNEGGIAQMALTGISRSWFQRGVKFSHPFLANSILQRDTYRIQSNFCLIFVSIKMGRPELLSCIHALCYKRTWVGINTSCPLAGDKILHHISMEH